MAENGNTSDKVNDDEATPAVEEESPVDGSKPKLQTVRSILKRGNTGNQSFKNGNGNISWNDFHGQDLAHVHEYERR